MNAAGFFSVMVKLAYAAEKREGEPYLPARKERPLLLI